jgi:hypothetical protein
VASNNQLLHIASIGDTGNGEGSIGWQQMEKAAIDVIIINSSNSNNI